jgi:hypothetical protein
MVQQGREMAQQMVLVQWTWIALVARLAGLPTLLRLLLIPRWVHPAH